MKVSAFRNIKNYCDGLLIYWRDVAEAIGAGDEDFTVDNMRFIHEDAIDNIMREEMAQEPYILGCFNAWFLADVLPVSQSVVEAMQKSEAFEALGMMIIDLGLLEDMQEKAAAADGYGYHFNHYDGSEDEFMDYYVFRTN